MNLCRARLAHPVIALWLGMTLLLSGCHSQSVKEKQQAQRLAQGFHTVVQAYKSGQFVLDGAVLSQIDLSSHFAYLRDQHRLPKRVLLLRSDKARIHKEHLQAMARMALDYKFALFYNRKGALVRVQAKEDNAAKTLQGAAPQSDRLPERMKGNTAAGDKSGGV